MMDVLIAVLVALGYMCVGVVWVRSIERRIKGFDAPPWQTACVVLLWPTTLVFWRDVFELKPPAAARTETP